MFEGICKGRRGEKLRFYKGLRDFGFLRMGGGCYMLSKDVRTWCYMRRLQARHGSLQKSEPISCGTEILYTILRGIARIF